MTLSDLAKYSSVARSLCDSWASCCSLAASALYISRRPESNKQTWTIQTTTENISVGELVDRGALWLFVVAPYKYCCLLAYLLTYLQWDWTSNNSQLTQHGKATRNSRLDSGHAIGVHENVKMTHSCCRQSDGIIPNPKCSPRKLTLPASSSTLAQLWLIGIQLEAAWLHPTVDVINTRMLLEIVHGWWSARAIYLCIVCI